MRNAKLRVGVLGLNVGAGHLKGYARRDDVEIAAIADLDEVKLGALGDEYVVERRLKGYRLVLEMDDVDAVSVCLPNFLHAPASIEALRAGK